MSVSRPPTNPILPGFNPDPCICRVGDDYFLVTSTFEYFPGVPIYHSKDLVNWTLIGHALTRPSQLNMRTVDSGGGVWAPMIRYHGGRWYMAVCCVWKWGRRPHLRVKPRGFFVYTDNIWDDRAWSEPVPIDMLGIDQDLFFDDDGKVYLCCAMWTTISPVKDRFSTYGVEFDIRTGRSLTRPKLLHASSLINDCAEGPHIYKRFGWYYLLLAEGGTEVHHRAMIYRSRHPLGPYDDPPDGVNPLINNAVDHPSVRQVGHADLFEDKDGGWWAVFLGTRPQKGSDTAQLGRETFLLPVQWDEGGWPVVQGGRDVTLGVIPGLPDKLGSDDWRDDLDSEQLSLGWYTLRTPVRPFHALSPSRGLTIEPNPYTIDMQESPALLLRKQGAYSGVWSTELTFAPAHATEEAGTTVYWSRYSYIAVLVRLARTGREARGNEESAQGRRGVAEEDREGGSAGDLEVVVRWVDEETDETKEHYLGQIPPTVPLTLTIRARPASYTCSYTLPSTSTAPSAHSTNGSSTLTLSSKVIQRDRLFDSPYTGAHFGLFAQDTELVQSFAVAHFRYAAFVVEQDTDE